MAMRIETVDILIEKAHFEPQVAVAVAQAIDETMDRKLRDAQLVTVPLLDSRLATLKSEITGGILQHVYTAVLGQLAVLLGVAYFFVSHVR